MTHTIEQEVTSLEISEAMKESGFPQESLFYWAKIGVSHD